MPLGREDTMPNCNEYWLFLICLQCIKNQLSLPSVKEEKWELSEPCFPPTLDCSHWSQVGYKSTAWLLGGLLVKRSICLGYQIGANLFSSFNGNLLSMTCSLRGRGWFGIEGELGAVSHLIPGAVVLELWFHSELLYNFVLSFHVPSISPWTSAMLTCYQCCSPTYQILNELKLQPVSLMVSS